MRSLLLITALVALTACEKHAAPAKQVAAATQAMASQVCDGDVAWLAPHFIASHATIANGTDDCPFYQAAWQHFLEAASGPDPNHAAFLDYPDVADLFGPGATPLVPKSNAEVESAALRVVQLPNDPAGTRLAEFGSGIRQAGNPQGILVDRFGNPIFYSIHVNPAFQTFTKQNGLLTAADLRNALPGLAINNGAPGSDGKTTKLGVAEYKAAWQVLEDPQHVPAGYIWRKALVPTIHRTGDTLTIDSAHPRSVTLVLISFHVAFTLDNHPEMIWATFEHLAANSTADNLRSDVAPSALARPPAAPVVVKPDENYILFAANSPIAQANTPADPKTFDEATQKFSAPTPIYRVFPGSKVDDDEQDDAVTALDKSMWNLLNRAGDIRGHYRLIGAVWLKNPDLFAAGQHFFNKDGQGTDDPNATLSGEGALSSTAMESFTQAPDSQPQCFTCHDTAQIKSSPAPGKLLVKAKEVNVSHVMSRFLSELP